jgi:excisionase family DNA binding protein
MPTSRTKGRDKEARLMTVKEAASYLAVSVATLYTRVSHREIPFVKLGRSIRFDRADLDAMIEESKVHPNIEGR